MRTTISSSAKPEPDSLWGIYLVDTFDNRVLIREEKISPCWNLFRFVPLRARRPRRQNHSGSHERGNATAGCL